MARLLVAIEQFCETHQFSETRFGRLSVGDKKLVPQLREGRELLWKSEERVRAFMRCRVRARRSRRNPDPQERQAANG